jgi:hypothetical protein
MEVRLMICASFTATHAVDCDAVSLVKSEQWSNNELTWHCMQPWYENSNNIIMKEH